MYESQTGLPDVPLQIVLLDGFDGTPTDSDNSEVASDIEMAISMAPGLSSVVVFEADPVTGQPNAVLQAMSTNTLIKQFSCSWDFGPITSAQRTTMDGYFMEFATQGQSFFDASGDSGAATDNIAMPAPDDDPYITLVGGTTLATAGPGAPWLSETVWNAGWGPGIANSGGGVSSSYAIPSWQKGVNMSANNGSTTKRNCPGRGHGGRQRFYRGGRRPPGNHRRHQRGRAVVGGLCRAGQPSGRGRRHVEHRLPQPGPLSHRHELRLHGLL